MERLTIINSFDGEWTIKSKECCVTCDFKTRDCSACPILEAFNKLAAYEDTGLTPEEVAEFIHEGLPEALDKLAMYESTGLQPEECAKLACCGNCEYVFLAAGFICEHPENEEDDAKNNEVCDLWELCK